MYLCDESKAGQRRHGRVIMFKYKIKTIFPTEIFSPYLTAQPLVLIIVFVMFATKSLEIAIKDIALVFKDHLAVV